MPPPRVWQKTIENTVFFPAPFPYVFQTNATMRKYDNNLNCSLSFSLKKRKWTWTFQTNFHDHDRIQLGERACCCSRLPCYVFCICMLTYIFMLRNQNQNYKSFSWVINKSCCRQRRWWKHAGESQGVASGGSKHRWKPAPDGFQRRSWDFPMIFPTS